MGNQEPRPEPIDLGADRSLICDLCAKRGVCKGGCEAYPDKEEQKMTNKIVAYYDGPFVTIYNVTGDFKEAYHGYSTELCKAITYHEITPKECVYANPEGSKTPTVSIVRGVNKTNVANYYVDEIWGLYAGQIEDYTNKSEKLNY